MKVLFFLRSTVYARNFESVLRLLAERGHDVRIVAGRHALPGSDELVDRLCREHPSIHHEPPPAVPLGPWPYLGLELRRAIDYQRYLGLEYADAPKLRARAANIAPAFATGAVRHRLGRSAAGRALLSRVWRWCDLAIPRDPKVDDFIRQRDPDIVMVTPLVEPGSPQSVFLRSARALGIRTGLCVFSWDNLTNKGLIHDPLDVVTVWNEAMKAEAVALHRVPSSRVVVTGAPAYDHWFDWRPATTREEFCARLGLRADRPYLLYTCSSKFIAPNEAAFVRRWLTELRAASAVLRDTGVLVRPHPQNVGQWETADVEDLDNVTVWPREGVSPANDQSRADYYDSIYHSRAVVGVNTSAEIESAVVGREVYTLLTDEFRETQQGTLHFRHLQGGKEGFLHVANRLDEHVSQLEAAVQRPPDTARCRRFVEAFVRPRGLGVPAAEHVVAAIEETVARGRATAARGEWWAPMIRPLLFRVALRLMDTRRAVKERAGHQKRLRQLRRLERAAHAERRRLAKGERNEARERQKDRGRQRRAAALAARAEVEARAYRNYREVRESARRMRGTAGPLSAEEERMRVSLAHLWEASEGTIAALRRQCEPISGVSPAAYDARDPVLFERLRREFRVLLRQMPRALLVEEPEVLGSFAYVSGGFRFNEDSVRSFKALAALQDGGVLGTFRGAAERRLVWEIGGGWGGFAQQFKTLCPSVTYVITGFPDLFLISAVYLETVFPEARVRLVTDEASAASAWREWEMLDFVFVPEGDLATFRPPRVDLVLDIMSLRRMPAERVCRHVRRAFDLDARYFYSLLPQDGTDRESSRVWASIERQYWPQPVPPRVERMPPIINLDGEPALESDCAHLVGWRRLQP